MKMYKHPILLTCLLLLIVSDAWSAKKQKNDKTNYLFVYFTGNDPQQEQICYAVSDNGFDYQVLNGGKPVVASDSISLAGGVRDPHILRGGDGWFYMVATDMRSSLGWSSNRGLVMMRSRDLVSWEHHTVHFPAKYSGTNFANVVRVWAPQTIYDDKAGKYMVYFSLLSNDGTIPYDKVFWCYANDDFSDLEGTPQVLFDYGEPSIDTDIVKDDEGTYHLFFKTEGAQHKGIRQYVFTDLHKPETWKLVDGYCEVTTEDVEGSGVFPLIGGGWCLMYDCYRNGHYQFSKSDDLRHFEFIKNTETTGLFTPRHGTVIQLSEKEKKSLLTYFNKN